MSLLDTAGSLAVWWRVILPFGVIGLIFTLIGIHILNTPRRVGYKVTNGTVKTLEIMKSEPKTRKDSTAIYYDYTYYMTVQFINKKTKETVISNLITTTQNLNSYYIGGSINIEYDKNNCTKDNCNIAMGNSVTKNTAGAITLLVGILCDIVALGAFWYRQNKNFQGAVVIGGTFRGGNNIMGKLADGALGLLKN